MTDLSRDMAVNTSETQNIKTNLKEMKDDFKEMKNDLHNIGNTFVSRNEFIEALKVMGEKMSIHISDTTVFHKDHERRVRNLEAWRWLTLGAVAVIEPLVLFLINKYL